MDHFRHDEDTMEESYFLISSGIPGYLWLYRVSYLQGALSFL